MLGYMWQGLQGTAYIHCYGHVGAAGEEILPKPGAARPGTQRCPLQGQTVPRGARSNAWGPEGPSLSAPGYAAPSAAQPLSCCSKPWAQPMGGWRGRGRRV